jgi:hypothetical protein
VLERLLFDGPAHKLALAGDGLLLRDALSLICDSYIGDMLLHRSLSVAQRREEARPDRPLGALHAKLATDLLLEAMIAGLAAMPLDPDPDPGTETETDRDRDQDRVTSWSWLRRRQQQRRARGGREAQRYGAWRLHGVCQRVGRRK